MKENDIANIIIKELLNLGFIVHRYNSVTTNSIYLKLDFGVCCGIRIADHSGKKKYHYRFNVVKGYKWDKIIYFKNLISFFYTFEEVPQLLEKVQQERQIKQQKYGINNYKSYMEKEKVNNPLFHRFKQIKNWKEWN